MLTTWWVSVHSFKEELPVATYVAWAQCYLKSEADTALKEKDEQLRQRDAELDAAKAELRLKPTRLEMLGTIQDLKDQLCQCEMARAVVNVRIKELEYGRSNL